MPVGFPWCPPSLLSAGSWFFWLGGPLSVASDVGPEVAQPPVFLLAGVFGVVTRGTIRYHMRFCVGKLQHVSRAVAKSYNSQRLRMTRRLESMFV